MKICKTKADLQNFLGKNQGTVGLVPTMGALHEGHTSLVKRSVDENDITVVSIFVNPIQFNNKSDLEKYPRTLEADCDKLKTFGCDIVFAPEEKEMYPDEINESYDFGDLERVMEGACRPGHFNGVAIVVKRLFDITSPDKAYFGMKDYQQLAIIKALVKQKNIPVEIVECPTVREEDGLAKSSRNVRLTGEQRNSAIKLSEVLFYVKENKEKDIPTLRSYVENYLAQDSQLKLEYFEIADSEDLHIFDSGSIPEHSVACIAAWAGEVRLIDNIILS